MLLPHLAALKSLAQLLSTRAMVELRDNHRDAAWTNLMTVTRLVTAYDPEPVEISHLARWALATTAYDLTWQALQAESWGDERLAALQREWESVDFFKRLPETAAFSGAGMVATCRAERREPIRLPGIGVSDVIRSPQSAWYTLADSWRRLRYRHHGTYEDEKALMLFHRDRELQLRRAVASASPRRPARTSARACQSPTARSASKSRHLPARFSRPSPAAPPTPSSRRIGIC